jgi:urease accessory protein
VGPGITPASPHPRIGSGAGSPAAARRAPPSPACRRGAVGTALPNISSPPGGGGRGQGEGGATAAAQAFHVSGIAEIGFARRGGVTRLAHLYQADPLRVLFPTPEAGDPIQAAIVTTSGGLVGGDRIDVAVRLDDGAAAHVTASAAEKIYRSLGPTTAIRLSLSIGAGAVLEFLPPETILFDGARLNRETTVEIDAGAAFLGGGIIVFGRRARGERFTRGFLREVWEIRREGRLVWGDASHLDGDIAAIVDDPACFDGAAAFATLILASAGPDGARAVQAAGPRGVSAGVTAVAGLLVARWLAADAALLRRAYAELACHLRAEALGLPRRLPRIWHV